MRRDVDTAACGLPIQSTESDANSGSGSYDDVGLRLGAGSISASRYVGILFWLLLPLLKLNDLFIYN